MTSRIRKVALTVHITGTLSWLGAIAGFLALAIWFSCASYKCCGLSVTGEYHIVYL
jgi:hypothetical protein